jgi:O-antigen/teichoic acid export membrane protein
MNPRDDLAGTTRSGGIVFFLASAGVNGLNLVFHLLMSRSLGPADYSALGALLALVVILAVPLSALQLACAQAQSATRPEIAVGVLVRRTVAAAAAIQGLCLLGAPLINAALHLQGLGASATDGAWVGLVTITSILQGVLVGALEFRAVAIATFAGSGLAKVLLGGLSGFLGGGVITAMLATVVGQAITVGMLLHPLRSRLSTQGEQLRPTPRDSLLSVGALTGLAALAAVDTVVARNTLPSHEAGLYVAAATAGRVTLFAPGAIALIAFPRFSAAAQRGESAERLLWQSALAVSVLGAAVAGFITLEPHLVIDVLFGSDYSGASSTLVVLALAGALLGVVNLLSYFHIAHRAWAALVGWGGTALIGVAVALRQSVEPHALALVMLGITGTCLLLSLSAALLIDAPRTERAVQVPAVDLESGTVIPAPPSHDVEAD